MALETPSAPRQASTMATGEARGSGSPFMPPMATTNKARTIEAGAGIGTVPTAGRKQATGGDLSKGKDMGGRTVPASRFISGGGEGIAAGG